ncbi:T9SS type B sorting domain-containing protein, partial [Maribacter arenosus]
ITDDDNCAPAPILNSAVQTAFCGTFTYDDGTPMSLNDYTDSTAPTGMVLTWSSDSYPLNEFAHLTPAEVDNPTNDGSYFGFFYDAANDCASGTIEVELTLNPIPVIQGTMGDERCGPGEVVLSASGAPDADQPPTFNWYASATGSTSIGTGQSLTQTISTTTSYWVEASADGCVSERQEVVATIYPLPSAGTPMNASACSIAANGPTIVDLDDLLTGEGSGAWTVTSDPSNSISIGIGNIVSFEGRVAGDYVFTFTTDNATPPFCENVSSEVTISVNDCDTDTDLDGLFDGTEITLGTDPNNADTDGDGIEDGVEVGDDIANPLNEDEDEFIDALESNIEDDDMDGVVDQSDPANTNPCIPDPSSVFCVATVDLEIIKTVNKDYVVIDSEDDEVGFTITVNNLSDQEVTLIQVNDFIDVSNGVEIRQVYTGPDDGDYNRETGVWDIPLLGAGLEATLTIYIRITTVPTDGIYRNTATIVNSSPSDFNLENNEDLAEVEVGTRSSNVSGFLFNQFSPDGNNINDFLIIHKIEDYPNNSIEIYDRYGNQVFEARPYDNTWDGTRNNTDVPKGTYFYVLDLGDGSEVRKGWIQIIR